MKRVLVAGSSGEIGSALTAAMLQRPGIELVAGIDLRPPGVRLPHFHFTRADIAQPCPDLLRSLAIDTVVHAAYTLQPTHRPRTRTRTATAGTQAILASAQAAGVRTFLHLSSATVYGARPGNPALLPESAPLQPNPRFPYATDKLAAESTLRDFLRQFPGAFSSVLILRPCFVLGRGTANAFMRHLCRAMVPLPAAQASMQFIHRDDLVEIVLRLLEMEVSGTYNVAAPGALTPATMVQLLGGYPLLIPDTLLTLAHRLAWSAHLPIAPAPAAFLDLLRFPWRVDCSALGRVLPRPFRHTTPETFQLFVEDRLLSKRSSKR